MTTPAFTVELGSLLPRHLFLEPLLAGARVLELGALSLVGGRSATALHDRGAASVVTVDPDADAVEEARRSFGGPGLKFTSAPVEALGAAAFDLVVAHDASWLESVDDLRRVLAPGGRLAMAIEGDAAYRDVAAALSSCFASVEVATIRPVAGWAVAPAQVRGARLAVDELGREPAAAMQFVFVCGRAPAGISTQRLAILPRDAVPGLERVVLGVGLAADDSAEVEALRSAEARLREENDALRADAEERRVLREENDALRADAEGRRALREENDALRAEIAALRERLEIDGARDDELVALEAEAARARASAKGLRDELAALHAGDAPDLGLDRLGTWGAEDTLSRRVREAEDRAESARLRAKEAEESMRAAERRAETAEGQRAEALMAARRLQLDVERARREAAAGRRPVRPE